MRLRTPELYQAARQAGKVKNKLALTHRGGGSWPTVHRFASEGPPASLVNLEALGRFLVAGLGISPEELRAMPIGALFEITEEEHDDTDQQ